MFLANERGSHSFWQETQENSNTRPLYFSRSHNIENRNVKRYISSFQFTVGIPVIKSYFFISAECICTYTEKLSSNSDPNVFQQLMEKCIFSAIYGSLHTKPLKAVVWGNYTQGFWQQEEELLVLILSKRCAER